jgi:hypothetical protein
MVKLNFKLKATTLMESLVAMIIIVVCFGVATMIYSNVLDSDKQRLQLKAMLLLNQQSIEIKKEKKFIDGEEVNGEWTIKRSIEHYQQSENLYQLTLSVIGKEENIIAKRNELIIIE